MAAEKVAKIRLGNDDWDVLFKKTNYTIGKTNIPLKPLSIEELVSVLNVFKTLQREASVIDKQDMAAILGGGGLEGIALKIFQHAPDVLSILSGVEVADLKKLPPTEGVKLFNACLDVNLESQEDLVKNLELLAQKINGLVAGPQLPQATEATEVETSDS